MCLFGELLHTIAVDAQAVVIRLLGEASFDIFVCFFNHRCLGPDCFEVDVDWCCF